MKKNIYGKYITIVIIFLFALVFVVKFAGQSILRLYIEAGIGSCLKIPILCMTPQEEIINPAINKEYSLELLPYDFPKMTICLPKGFAVVQEGIKKIYYKKRKYQHSGAVIYLLREEPNFFLNLFPQLNKQGIIDDYEFIKRTMYVKLKDVKSLTDAFFVIMKGIFTPDLGEQKNVEMAQFRIADKKGFINYTLSHSENYFDCNIIDAGNSFFKIYIKDKGATLDLNKVLTIISTVKEL